MRIRKNDTVYIRSGADKGKTGRVLFVNYDEDTIVVEGINMRKKHQRPSQKNPKGGVISIEVPIHLSNVALYSSSTGKPVKFAAKIVDDGGKKRRVRVNVETQEQI
jgi:large subunit ribosomal protein L24